MEQPKKDLENIKLKLIDHINANYEKDQAKNFIENINSIYIGIFDSFLPLIIPALLKKLKILHRS